MLKTKTITILLAAVLLCPAALAQKLIPGPGQAGFDEPLWQKAMSYDRQFHTFNALPFGLSLDAWVPNGSHRDLVTQFLGQTGELDFETFSGGMHPYDVIDHYSGQSDVGMFGGVPAAGEAFRYMTLRDEGADPAEVDAARQDLLDAIEATHVACTIVGEPGIFARGIRMLSEPGSVPATEPIPADCPGNADRHNIWRDDGSGQYPGFIYMDNCSKDQLLGYVMGMGAFWDAIATDPSIPEPVKVQLQQDALALGESLMVEVEVRPGTSVDLVITDWNGCATRHHDLNPRILVQSEGTDPIVWPEDFTNQNGWNALASLGVIRTLYHITGDDSLRTFYYDELITNRDYPTRMVTGIMRVNAMYINTSFMSTNFSNVNMAYVAAYGLLRYESDPVLRDTFQALLQDELWDTNKPHDGIEIQQAFFNVMYSGFRTDGNQPATTQTAVEQLKEFVDPPYYNPSVTNCDSGELSSGTCTLNDGVTVVNIDDNPNWHGNQVSETPIAKWLRPPGNFEWRTDPRLVNGGGGNRLNPGGDFRIAYWMGRMLKDTDDGDDNMSDIVWYPDGSGGPDGGTEEPDGGQPDGGDEPIEPDGGDEPADQETDGGLPDSGPDEDLDAGGEDAGEEDAGGDQPTPEDTDDAGSDPGPDEDQEEPAADGQDGGGQEDGGGDQAAGSDDDEPADDGCGCSHQSPSRGWLSFMLLALLSMCLTHRSSRRS